MRFTLVLEIEDDSARGGKVVKMTHYPPDPRGRLYYARWVSPMEMKFLRDSKEAIASVAGDVLRALLKEILP